MQSAARTPAGGQGQPHRLVDHAFLYAREGWPVFPLRPRGKAPLTRNGVKDATTDSRRIARWWQRQPEANIGLAIPDGYLVLDLDTEDALHRLKVEDRVLPATAWARTAQGYHFWFRADGEIRNRVGLLEKVDVRAAGGYVVAPPSVHPSGVAYSWEVELAPSAVAEAPSWLVELLEPSRPRQGREVVDWHRTLVEPVPQGRRNQALAEVSGLLFRYLPAVLAADLALCWAQVKLKPALPEPEVLRTINSIAGRELRRQGGKS
ncbi:MAG: bifunctional DNA primase/polymerase [Acidobacteriota bacterium]|nr:bifunctional DNA primase/polymerase [Acidobacteriota bacterium]